jgi:acyl carrier protein
MSELQAVKAILSRALFVPEEMIPDDADISAVKPLDSLAFESLVLEIEQHLGVEFDVVRLIGVKSVRDLAAVLEKAR